MEGARDSRLVGVHNNNKFTRLKVEASAADDTLHVSNRLELSELAVEEVVGGLKTRE